MRTHRAPDRNGFSGPAGGVRAAVLDVGTPDRPPGRAQLRHGRTRTDAALSRDGHAAVRGEFATEYDKIRVPSLDVVAIGAGGGSIAHVPGNGALRVGPVSAVAGPAPARYGQAARTRPSRTPTWCWVIRPAARRAHGNPPRPGGGAVEQVASSLGVSLETAARSIIDVVNDRMLGGLRLVSVQRGHDPRGFTLFAFGGAGPLHANALLELLGSPLAVVPPAPGVCSTFGFLVADMQREFAASHIRRLSRLSREELVELVNDLAGQGRDWLAARGFEPDDQRVSFQFGMRYTRQGYELPVLHADPAADPQLLTTLADTFAEVHRRTYDFELNLEPEVVVVRCVAAGRKAAPPMPQPRHDGARLVDAVTDADHRIYWDSDWLPAPRYARDALRPGHERLAR